MRIGGDEYEFVAITLIGRSHSGCTDYWDGNWIRAKIEVAAGGFRGSVVADLRSDELATFHEQLSRLLESLQGTAEFTTLEEQLLIRVQGDGSGHMAMQCVIMDQAGIGNTLNCKFEYDQSFVRPMVAQIANALREYPVIGQQPNG